MSGAALWIGVLAGLAGCFQVFSVVNKRIRRAHTVHETKRRQLAEASRLMREKAKITLDLKRERRTMRSEVGQLAGDIDRGEEVVAKHKRLEDYLRVFDERKNIGDQAFIVLVTHPDFSQLSKAAPPDVLDGWRHGHRYLVWAASPKTAKAKAAMRHPADKGYVVGQAEPCTEDAEEL